MLEILLGRAYGLASTSLVVLLFATVLLALLVLNVTLLNAGGAERLALGISGGTVVCGIALLFWLLRSSAGLETEPLERAALGTLGTMTLGFVTSSVAVRRRLGANLPVRTALRAVVAAALVLGLCSQWEVQTLFGLIAKAAFAGVLFLASLLVSREISREDRAAMLRIVGFGGPNRGADH